MPYIKYTTEELLAECRRRGFVKGCRYKNISNDIRIADEDPYLFLEGQVALGVSQGLIYNKGEWGELIVPIPKVINNYLIY